ncbi:MAG: DUF4357 domain-containing protein, partial [Burkholderiales bacterium]|nr:DUF4357 domain-containing protein [Burkholderiales bacterium]
AIETKSATPAGFFRFILKNKNKKTGTYTVATMLSDNSKFILKKGSNILFPPEEEKFLGSKQKKIKNGLLQNGEISQNKNGIFTLNKDLTFTSPSTMAIFVLGSSVNGRREWKTAEGKTFNEVFPKDTKSPRKNSGN